MDLADHTVVPSVAEDHERLPPWDLRSSLDEECLPWTEATGDAADDSRSCSLSGTRVAAGTRVTEVDPPAAQRRVSARSRSMNCTARSSASWDAIQ